MYRVLQLGQYRATSAREMLARAGFGVAQLGRAAQAICRPLTVNPSDLARFMVALVHALDEV